MAGGLFDPQILYDVLNKAGMLPKYSPEYPMGGGDGQYRPARNLLISPQIKDNDTKNTMAHELTHAVQFNLFDTAIEALRNKEIMRGLKPEEQQFVDAYRKMRNNDKLVNSLYLKGASASKQDEYRTTPNELQAWGVGNMSQPDPDPYVKKGLYKNAPHLDASMATELSILLDLYQKLPEKVRASGIEERKKNVDEMRKYPMNDDVYDFVNVFSNPFKSTIK